MTENLLDKSIRKELEEVFQQQLKQPVQLIFFGSQNGCEYCEETLQLSQEVVELSEHIHLSSHDLDREPDLARSYHVDKVPTLVVAALDGEQASDHGIRFAGIPAGHEFSSFIQAIIMVSERDSNLEAETREFLQTLEKPLHFQVFVTPT